MQFSNFYVFNVGDGKCCYLHMDSKRRQKKNCRNLVNCTIAYLQYALHALLSSYLCTREVWFLTFSFEQWWIAGTEINTSWGFANPPSLECSKRYQPLSWFLFIQQICTLAVCDFLQCELRNSQVCCSVFSYSCDGTSRHRSASPKALCEDS